MAEMLPRRHLRTNQLSIDRNGQMWRYVPPNLVQYTPPGGGDGDGENGDRLEPPVQPPIQSRVETTPVREPPKEPPPRRREPEPERHRRRR